MSAHLELGVLLIAVVGAALAFGLVAMGVVNLRRPPEPPPHHAPPHPHVPRPPTEVPHNPKERDRKRNRKRQRQRGETERPDIME